MTYVLPLPSWLRMIEDEGSSWNSIALSIQWPWILVWKLLWLDPFYRHHSLEPVTRQVHGQEFNTQVSSSEDNQGPGTTKRVHSSKVMMGSKTQHLAHKSASFTALLGEQSPSSGIIWAPEPMGSSVWDREFMWGCLGHLSLPSGCKNDLH